MVEFEIRKIERNIKNEGLDEQTKSNLKEKLFSLKSSKNIIKLMHNLDLKTMNLCLKKCI